MSPAWITYIGNPGAKSTVVTSSVANASSVFVGGYTNETTLASTANPTGGYVGFVSGLTAAAGTLSGIDFLYVDANNPNNNSVQALALDGSNNLYLTGVIGTTITTGLAITPTANAFAVPGTPAVTTYNASSTAPFGNAYVAQYPLATLFTAGLSFFTYIQGNTLASAIAVDKNNLIYVAGTPRGNFSAPPAPVAKIANASPVFELNFSINPDPCRPEPGGASNRQRFHLDRC